MQNNRISTKKSELRIKSCSVNVVFDILIFFQMQQKAIERL